MRDKTFAIIKPDAVNKGYTGKIYDRILKANFNIIGAKLLQMTPEKAKEFYSLHKDKPLETLGEYVTHLDTVMFEQGWFFMSSATPYDSYMTRQGSFEQVTTHDLDAFNPDKIPTKIPKVKLSNPDTNLEIAAFHAEAPYSLRKLLIE